MPPARAGVRRLEGLGGRLRRVDLRWLLITAWSWGPLVVSLGGLPIIASVAGAHGRSGWVLWAIWAGGLGYSLWVGRVIRRTYLLPRDRGTS